MRLAQESLEGWRALEADSGETLLELTGLVELAPPGVESSRAALEACGARFEETEVPGFDGSALFQPDAGIVRADLAHRAFLEGALRRGASLVEETRDRAPRRARRGRRRRHRGPVDPAPDPGPARRADPRDGLLLPARRRAALADRARHRARRRLLRAPRPRRRHQGRPPSLGSPRRSRHRGCARPGDRRAPLRLGRRALPRGRPGARARRDVLLHEHRRRALPARAARPDRRRLRLQRPRVQVRARGGRSGSLRLRAVRN